MYKCCRVCHCKVVEKSELTAECPKCNSRVKLGKCPSTSSARFVIEDDAWLTTLFGDTVATSPRAAKTLHEDKLLNTPKQMYFFSLKNVVAKVSRVWVTSFVHTGLFSNNYACMCSLLKLSLYIRLPMFIADILLLLEVMSNVYIYRKPVSDIQPSSVRN